MKMNSTRRFVLAISTVLLIGSSTFGQSKAAADIRKVMDDQTAAWNRGDVEAFMAIGYWKSEKLKFVSGDKVTYGWQQTLDNYKRSYATKALMGTLTFGDLEIEVLSKDAAFVVGSWSLAREKDTPHGKFTLLFRKFKEGWRIVTDHTS
ncbi:MAG: nuclear transport factor 2 family protein [Pyrinomonadaceae bacterium]